VTYSLDGGTRWTFANSTMQSGGSPEYLSTFGPSGAIGGALGGQLYRTVNGIKWREVPAPPAGKYRGESICTSHRHTVAMAHDSYDDNGTWQ
jgi:hypothetical protein